MPQSEQLTANEDDGLLDDIEGDGAPSENKQDSTSLASLINEIRTKCLETKLEVIEDEFEGEIIYKLKVPNGREKRSVYIFSDKQAQRLLNIEFEKFTYVSNYDAICSYEKGLIIAAVRSLSGLPSYERTIFGQDRRLIAGQEQSLALIQKNDGTGIHIEIINSTIDKYSPLLSSRTRLMIKITGVDIAKNEDAVSILERVANSLFFEIDLTTGTALSLVRTRSARIRRLSPRRERIELEFPKNEYDTAPISLYWYGRSATGMPLLQYLAFYQVLEFYFPIYARKEAARRVRNILKHPAFRIEKDSDITKVVTAVEGGARGAFGDERSQLRATIQECIDASELEKFYRESDDRAQFFSNRQKGLTDHKISLSSKSPDIRTETANLIYDLRCKIVHTKGDEHEGGQELLLPFTKEADLLAHDVDLIHHIARQVLITSSVPLNI